MSGLLDQLGARLGFCREQIPGKGEDSFCYSLNARAALVGVFDGLGGSGAMGYEEFGGHKGAYVASRAAAGALMRWFDVLCAGKPCSIDTLQESLLEDLKYCESLTSHASGLKGSIVRSFPTTMAAWLLLQSGGEVSAYSISAGDSRNYLLDQDGLGQVSQDDLGGVDAMTNLYQDAPMTNVLSAEGGFFLHRKRLPMAAPGVLISATDGCFGYLKSPMEFEFLLLETLNRASNPAEWEALLLEEIAAVAGDDHTILLLPFGYRSFKELRQSMKPRYKAVNAVVSRFPEQDMACRAAEWERGKAHYYRFAEGGVPVSE